MNSETLPPPPPPPPGPVGQPMTVDTSRRAPVAAPVRRRRRRRRFSLGGLVVALLVAAVVLIKTGHNPLPVDVPLVGRNADDVYRDIKDAGLPVAYGTPKSNQFRDVVDNNSCKSSRS